MKNTADRNNRRNSIKADGTPGAGGKSRAHRALAQMLICAVVLLAICVICRLALRNTYFADIPLDLPNSNRVGELRVEAEDPSVLSEGAIHERNGYLRVPVKPEREGGSMLRVVDRDGRVLASHYLEVRDNYVIRDLSSGGFSGDYVMLVAFTLFCFLSGLIMVWHFRKARGQAFYDYSTIYFSGFSLFAFATALVMLVISIRHLREPAAFPMMSVYTSLSAASWQFMQLTFPAVLVFALAMVVSNLVLLRHMTPRIQNVLGILIGLMMLAGEGLAWFLYTRDFSGSEWEWRIQNLICNVYATVYVYFECMLAGAAICGFKATRMKPSMDRDFIIILGCGFRKDGTLPPLLRGRVDRAVSFWREQKQRYGREAAFIPSGGQGMDEVMPEAEAMKRYLLEQGIPASRILKEDRSTNTLENMRFSGEIMEKKDPRGKAVFATTNYHVFRGGIWANRAGVRAEGIGSRTKWWFWPNAFMRECLGLLLNRWKSELVLLAVLIAFFSTLTMLLG